VRFPRAFRMRYGVWRAWTDCAVIRIRYKDFSAGTHDMAGLHGRVERCARGVTVCLLPGLTARQRRTVIRRLRQEASRGFGPALPLPQLAIALGLDRVRTTTRIARAIVRLHPAVTLVPSALVVAMVTLFVIAAGDRPGIVPGTGRGLADAAAVSGGAARVLGSSPSPVRVTRVTVAEGTGGSGDGGTGLGSGQRAAATHAHRKRSKGEQQGRAKRKQSAGGSVRPAAWYTCSPRPAATPRPRDRQLACRRPAPRAVPHTAHRPGPLDFAW
jgi:hypothetical protein